MMCDKEAFYLVLRPGPSGLSLEIGVSAIPNDSGQLIVCDGIPGLREFDNIIDGMKDQLEEIRQRAALALSVRLQ